MKKTELTALLLLLLLFLLFRVVDLETLPAWDWDEGVNLNVSWNLSMGRAVLFTVRYLFIPHPPLFFLLSSFLVGQTGLVLFWFRLFAVFLELLSLVFLFFVGCRMGGLRLGVLSAFLFAVYPGSVYWGRMFYANHLLALLFISAFYFYIRGGRWIYLSSFLAGLALITEYTGIGVVVSILYLFYRERRDGLPLAVVVSSFPMAVFLLITLPANTGFFVSDLTLSFSWHILGASGVFFVLVTLLYVALIRLFRVNLTKLVGVWRDIFVYDVNFILGEKSKIIIKQNPIVLFAPFYIYLAYTYPITLSDDLLFYGMDFFWLGLFGFFCAKNQRKQSLAFFAPMFLIIFVIGRSDHMLIPLYPYFALGLSMLVFELWEQLTVFIGDLCCWKYARHIVFLMLFLPLLKLVYSDYASFVLGENIRSESVSDYLAVAEYVNQNTVPNDIIIGNSHMFRFIKSRCAILTESLSMSGRKAVYYQKPPSPSRILFNASYPKVKYLIGNPGLFEWLENESLSDVSKEFSSWPVEFNNTLFTVYRNPHLEDEAAVEDKPPPQQ